jgi:hypothetical protein
VPTKYVNVLDMRPTQHALGIKDSEHKVKKLKKMSAKQRKQYLSERLIQVVLGPKSIYYIIDHHHLVRACWEAGIKKVPVEVKGDFSTLDMDHFWVTMRRLNFVHPYDQFGEKQMVTLFPRDVRGMADDPYRSLAWAAREAGGFTKTFVPFSEFKWANYFRKHINIEDVHLSFSKAVKRALTICKTKGAASLPGYK